jgi:hypothetical protein
MPLPGEEERAVREDDKVDSENGDDRPKDLEREVPKAGCSRGDMVGLS